MAISFNINSVNPKYDGIDDVNSLFEVRLKYFIAGTGRCSAGQCGSEFFNFFVQLKDPSTGQIIDLIQVVKRLSDVGGAFDGEVQFSKIITTAIPQIDYELFMWDLSNTPMTDVFSFFINRTDPQPDPVPTPDMVSQSFNGITFLDDGLGVSAKFTSTNNFDEFFVGQQLRWIVQVKNLLGQIIDVVESQFQFDSIGQSKNLNVGINSVIDPTVIVESFVWDDQDRPFTDVIAQQTSQPKTNMVTQKLKNGRLENGILTIDVELTSTNEFPDDFLERQLSVQVDVKDSVSGLLVGGGSGILKFSTIGQIISVPIISSGIEVAPVDVISNVFFNAQNKISEQVGIQVDVLQDPTPNPDMMTQSFVDLVLDNGVLVGSVNITTTQNFDAFFFDKPQRHFVQIKNLGGTILDIVETAVVFEGKGVTKNVPVFFEGINEDSLIVESFVWDDNNLTFSNFLSEQVDGIVIPPDDDVNDNSVSFTPENFKIENNVLSGIGTFTANPNFNPFWFGKVLLSVVSIFDENDNLVNRIENNVVFTENAKTKQIFINVDLLQNITVEVEFILVPSLVDPRNFIVPKIIQVLREEILEGNEFSQNFFEINYRETPFGKSLFVQVNVDQLKQVQFVVMKSTLQVKRLDGTVIDVVEQQVSVSDAVNFPIVYDIPDLTNPTAIITVEHFLSTVENIFVSDKIEAQREIDQQPPIPPGTPGKIDPFKAGVGVFTLSLIACFLSDKDRK